MKSYCVITTINKPTRAIEVLYNKFNGNIIIVGDEKTPANWCYKDSKCIFEIKKYAPKNSYARKNLGYLEAMRNGAEIIYDTDDDNVPLDNFKIKENKVFTTESSYEGWFNVYRFFNFEQGWPRGFSLKNINNSNTEIKEKKENISSIQQNVVNGDTDVDAIWRFISNEKIIFSTHKSVFLKPNTWCPFNSQNTWWFPRAYILMYLPIYASFRMTDIWRSFIAQRCLWEISDGVTYNSPAEIFQNRNEHDILNDFKDEISGYLNNDKIIEILGDLKLKKGEGNISENMVKCYQSIMNENILPKKEMFSLKMWIKDYEKIRRNLGRFI